MRFATSMNPLGQQPKRLGRTLILGLPVILPKDVLSGLLNSDLRRMSSTTLLSSNYLCTRGCVDLDIPFKFIHP